MTWLSDTSSERMMVPERVVIGENGKAVAYCSEVGDAAQAAWSLGPVWCGTTVVRFASAMRWCVRSRR